MCLAVPAEVIALDGEMAVVEMAGVKRDCSVAFISDLKLGDYVLLHAGFAIQKWSLDDVREYEQMVAGIVQPESGHES